MVRLRFLILLLAPSMALAENWSGFLVDSRCYASEERNVNAADTQPHVDSDMNWQVRFCAAGTKTRDYAVVPEDWQSLKFDPAGNARAHELVRQLARKHLLRVVVSGDRNRKTIQVRSISVAP